MHLLAEAWYLQIAFIALLVSNSIALPAVTYAYLSQRRRLSRPRTVSGALDDASPGLLSLPADPGYYETIQQLQQELAQLRKWTAQVPLVTASNTISTETIAKLQDELTQVRKWTAHVEREVEKIGREMAEIRGTLKTILELMGKGM